MGGAVPALVNQIAIMLSIMGIGCMLFRMKIIDRAGAKQMADVVIYLACPAITLRTLMVDFDPGKLFDAGFCMALMTVVTLVSIPLTRLFFKSGEGVARYGAIFANSGFIGVPIVQGVFGEGYVFYLSIGTSVLNFFIWTYGVWLVSGDRDQMSLARVVRNPNLIAIVVGLACFVFSVHPPRLLDDVLAALGDVNKRPARDRRQQKGISCLPAQACRHPIGVDRPHVPVPDDPGRCAPHHAHRHGSAGCVLRRHPLREVRRQLQIRRRFGHAVYPLVARGDARSARHREHGVLPVSPMARGTSARK